MVDESPKKKQRIDHHPVSEDDVDMTDADGGCGSTSTDDIENEPKNEITLHVGSPKNQPQWGPKIIFSAPIPNSTMFFGCGWRLYILF